MNDSVEMVKDSLTQVTNRDSWLNYAASAIDENDNTSIIFFIDLDRFKFVNDSLGHDAGDLLLVNAANIISNATDSSQDLVGRMGGDEFVVLLQAPKSVKAWSQVANQIIDEIGKPVLIGTTEIEIGASIGVSAYPRDADKLETLMKYADLAMYRAKNSGRNQVVSFNEQMVKKIEFRRNVQMALRRLLKEDLLQALYQPVYDSQQQKTVAVELKIDASADAKLELLDQAELFSLIDESQLSVEISEWMFQQGLELLQTLNESGIEINVIFSVRPSHFHHNQFVDWLAELIDEYGIAPENVVLQLNDYTLNAQRFPIEKKLVLINKIGVEVAVHNFGTGHISPLKLHDWPLAQLDLSSSYVHSMTSKKSIANMTEALIKMGHMLNKRVVAYGVTASEQQAFLNSHQCYLMQGPLFGEPMSAEDLELEQLGQAREEDNYFRAFNEFDEF